MLRSGYRPPTALSALIGFLCLALLSAVACQADSPPAEPDPAQFIGSFDEVIGPRGTTIAEFTDADFVQLLRPDDIPPIYAPEFIPAAEAILPADELVIGLSIANDHRAYPAGILFNREMVNDVVANLPVLVTWCPRCYTALVHQRTVDGEAVRFGNHGALYRGAMTWFDHNTGSIWSQPLGTAVAGPVAGTRLPLIPSEFTTWKDWLSAHPDTLVLTDSRPALPFRGNFPGRDHVVGIVIPQGTVAVPHHQIPSGGGVQINVGDSRVNIWRDAETRAIRAAQVNQQGVNERDIPVFIAYRSSWLKFYPDSIREIAVESP